MKRQKEALAKAQWKVQENKSSKVQSFLLMTAAKLCNQSFQVKLRNIPDGKGLRNKLPLALLQLFRSQKSHFPLKMSKHGDTFSSVIDTIDDDGMQLAIKLEITCNRFARCV